MKHMVQLSVLMVFMMSSQISSKFPIKDCDNPDKEFLIVFDCRRDMRDQIKQFSEMAIGYLRTGRNWSSLNVDYMVHTPNGLVKLNHKNSSELTASADGLEKNCSADISIDNIFNTTRTFFTPKSNTIQVSFIMLGRNISTLADDQQSVEDIADRQDKEPDVYRFFVIVTPDERNFVVKNYTLYTESFQATNLYAFFLKVCDANCTKNAIGYSVDDNFKSYYHFDFLNKTTLSYGEKLCHTNYNSYLLSLECMTELENVQKLNFTNNKRYGAINILVGLQGENDFSWASGNPFLVRSFIKWKSFILNNKKRCVVLTLVSKNGSDRYDVEWHALNCDDDIDNVYIGCECHVTKSPDVDKAKYFIINGEKPSSSILPTQSLINNLKTLFFSHEKIASSFLDPDTVAERTITVCNTTNVTYTDNFGNFMCQSENWNYTVIEISNNTVLKGFNNFVFTTKRIDENGNNEVSNASKYINSVEDQFNSTYYTKCDENNSSDVEPYAPRCIFSKLQNNIPLLECKYKINLLDCEDFKCSTGYFKCPKSYCIPLYQVNDGVKDCTRGEDENVVFKTNNKQCTGHMVLKAYDMCLETDIWNQVHADINVLQNKYICKVPCSQNLTCFSSVTKDKNVNSSIFNFISISISSPFFKVSDILLPHSKTVYILTLFKPIELRIPGCKVIDFDTELRKIDNSELLVLDLSKNKVTTSNKLKNVSQFKQLRFLNLSYNTDFDIDQNFTFPSTLEIVDVSNTKIQAMPTNVFQNLTDLKHLNLSYTKISSFGEMGISKNFKLKSLDIRGIEIKEIHSDYFQSLSISDLLLASDYRLCCEVILGTNIPVEKCHAPSDAISTCQHLVGDTLKRVIIWIVGFITIFGNGFVLVYRLTWDSTKKHNTTQIFFVICLAVSDFVMGIYLVIIASADIYFRNEYVLNETDWRYGDICRFSGFLSTISSETSTFFICWITYDRYTAMKYHCGRYTMPKRLKYAAFLSSWILGFSLALIPAVYSEWEIYSSNGMCLALPLNTGHFKGWEYSFAVFVILNFVLFMLIAVGQVAIFFIIAKTRKNVNGSAHGNVCNREIAAAQKLALVAISDFLCWFPIGILGMLSLGGYTYNIDVYAWVAIFILPINSAVNPLLYTIPEIHTLLTKKQKSPTPLAQSRERVPLRDLEENTKSNKLNRK
ncbi:hypothetical protein Btru_078097 [Bulinus truncatus]|nr:hypothetical protein Btru_078097 [Bulinus truncatus]